MVLKPKHKKKKNNVKIFFFCFVSLISVCRRPGVLVLINDCDWELEGGLEYELESGDTVVFISTLHGG